MGVAFQPIWCFAIGEELAVQFFSKRRPEFRKRNSLIGFKKLAEM
jgi:hypothetical protein